MPTSRVKFETKCYDFVDRWLRKILPPHTPDIKQCGNYHIDGSILNKDSVVYSCGVGKNIRFDKAIHEQFGCDVNMFDPTSIAVEFMKTVTDRPCLRFHPWGIWTEDATMKFYFKDGSLGSLQNLSVTNLEQTDNYCELDCYTLTTIMKKLGHDRIDVLKMDIEGAALPILQHLLQGEIRPGQMVFEVEKGKKSLLWFHWSVYHLLRRMKRAGYTLFFLPRKDNARYNLQFLAVSYKPAA